MTTATASPLDLLDAGVAVAAIVDLRADVPPSTACDGGAATRVCASSPATRSTRRSPTLGQARHRGRAGRGVERRRHSSTTPRESIRVRPDPDVGGLRAGGAPAASRRRQVRLRRRQRTCTEPARCPPICSPPARSTGAYASRCRGGRRAARRLGGGARCGLAAGAEPPAPVDRGGLASDPSLADLPAQARQGLRRFRRGPAGEGPDQRRRRRLRRHRAAEALLDRRHGPVARASIRPSRRCASSRRRRAAISRA